MESNIEIDIIEEDIMKYGKVLLDILLKDRTTNHNIVWATNDYLQYGSMYKANMEIQPSLITGFNSKIIQPRIKKAKEHQSNRTREKAEVFTPSWLCNEQNNLVDEQWFGRKDVFNNQLVNTWDVNKDKIIFPNEKSLSWKNYVDARRMEISCGEAPYLVSRYDTVTGDVIPILSRIGLLDRKLRVINENVNDEVEWFKWVERAFQSIYGYEYQGDNLLLARQNLFYTFIDNIKYKFEKEPSLSQLKKIATIISWNVWQMDGITFTIPFCDVRERMQQLSIFDFTVDIPDTKFCKIKDWRSRVILEYMSLVKGER